MSTGTEGRQDTPAEPLPVPVPLHDAHVACWRDSQLAISLNDRAIAAYEREHGPMTDAGRRMVR